MRFDIHHHHYHHYDMDPKTAEAWRLLLEALGTINRKLEKIMADIAQVTADFDAFVAKVAAKFADMSKQIEDLKATVAANDPSATNAAIDALDAHINNTPVP